jgi:hypothetical protein
MIAWLKKHWKEKRLPHTNFSKFSTSELREIYAFNKAETKYKRNPGKGTTIYKKVLEIRATQNQSDGIPRSDRFVHKFTSPVRAIGNSDGSVTLKSKHGKKLWKRFK